MKIKAPEKKTRHSGMFRLLQTAGGFSLLAFALAANIGEGIGNAFAASAAGRMLDAFIGGERRGAVEYMAQGIAFAALLAVSIVVKDSLLGSYQERGMVRLREKTIAALGRSRMDWLDGHHTGELSSRATGDLNALGNALRPVLIMGLSRTFAQLIVVFYLFQMNWVLTLTIFAVVPVTTFLQWVGSSPIKRYQQVNRSAAAQLSAVVADYAGAFETVKSLNLETEMRRRFSAVNGEQYEAGIRENRVAALLAPLSTLGRYLPQFVLVIFGGLLVIRGSLTIGQLTVFLGLSHAALQVMDNLFTLITSLRQLGVNAERITALWDIPQEGGKPEDAAAKNDTHITFQDVSFTYNEKQERNTLSDISFEVERGSFTAIVGESGCGKSTVLKLAAALYTPSSGSIQIFGSDVRTSDPEELRRRVAYVTQDTWLFDGSLAENIACNKDCTREDIARYAALAGLSEFIARQPDGIDTRVGERGGFLSGGQKQRIALARAICKNADLLLLDEATSSLDASMEARILDTLVGMEGWPAILMITHRLINVKDAGLIIVLKDGRVCQRGTHAELEKSGGEYARLLERQRGEVDF